MAETLIEPGPAAGAEEEPDELFLIDANSLVYRAFFALPESIATSTGFPTNAIFGFASMLVKILTEHGSKPTLVVWDAGSSGRKEVYEEYKGHRPKQPDLLKEQYPHLRPLVEAFGYRNVAVEGYEADDVIASLAEQARARGIPVMVVTGDRDAFQLVADAQDGLAPVRVMATSRGITETKTYDRDAVVDRYGIEPELVPDLIGLKGDTSDNIPGVPGIGDKTAAQLLQRFGSVEGVLEHIDDVSGAKRKQNLTEHADAARLSKALATAKRDIPVPELDVEAEAAREPDRGGLREAFRRFELREPLRRLEEALEAVQESVPAARTVQTVTASLREGPLAELEAVPGTELAVAVHPAPAPPPADPEPAEAEDGQLPIAATAPDPAAAYRFAAFGGGKGVLVGGCAGPEALVEAAGDRPVVAHDAKALRRVPERLVHDTRIAAFLLDPARRGFPLAELCEDRGLGTDLEDPAAAEALLVHALGDLQRVDLAERDLQRLLDEVELPLVHVLRSIEEAGLKLDEGKLAEITDRVRAEVVGLEREIYELAGEEFTLGSPQQLGAVLFDKLGLSRRKRGKTGFSTDASVLQTIRDEHPIVVKVERHRELSKLVSTYLEALPDAVDPADGRIHTTFSQVGAATGRLSSTDPNLQNIPVRTPLGREIRACFVAEPGNALISADYSQVELRILAHVAGEEVLKDIFRRGEDVHTATAAQVFGVPTAGTDPFMRSKAKMVNYGIVYGLSAYGLSERLRIPQEEAQEFIDRYLDRFPAVRAYIDSTVEQARERGYVTTMFGRRRYVPEIRARQFQVRSLGERLAVNAPIQGSAADVMKLAMIRTQRALTASGLATRLILTIHDELLFEGPEGETPAACELVAREMVSAVEMDPPLEVDVGVGPNWLDAK